MKFAKIKLSYATSLAVYGTPDRAKSVTVRVIDHIVTDIVDYYIYETLCPKHAIILQYGSTQRVCKDISSAIYFAECHIFDLPF